MHHSPMIRTLGMVTWVITAIASINMLTAMYDYDLFAWVMRTMPGMIVPMFWIVGLSGLISLAMFVKMTFMGCPACGQCPCSCSKM